MGIENLLLDVEAAADTGLVSIVVPMLTAFALRLFQPGGHTDGASGPVGSQFENARPDTLPFCENPYCNVARPGSKVVDQRAL